MVLVQLLVYDLSRGMASAMSEAILGQRIDGIWHTGVLVFNSEYYYGGGIQISPLGVFSASNGLHPVQMINLGETEKTREELTNFLRAIGPRFTGEDFTLLQVSSRLILSVAMTYDLIRNNCNNFSDEIARFLVGRGIPEFIVNRPALVFSTPGGAALRPMIGSWPFHS